ncbi:hypothetical protein [Clostridium thermarum]|uniref:hypothetical protein n=1 Tax=Clostridium thermarum TaxID=1716543 RepID=UPI0013D86A9B|nr:hypothetical protein [Clostridium thermarum]
MKRVLSSVLSILVCTTITFSVKEMAFAAGIIDLKATPVNNAVGTSDTLTVTNLSAGDVVKVYSSYNAAKPIGTAVAKTVKGESKATAIVNIPQFGASAGTIYISVTEKGLLESNRIAVPYAAEKQTQVTSVNASIENNAAGTPDTVVIYDLVAGDIVKVYSSNTSDKPLGTATAKAGKGETLASATISIPQLGASAGTAYITVTRKGLLEGIRIPVTYVAEKKTAVSVLSASIVNNAVGTPDVVTVTNLSAGDTVKVYLSNTDTKVAGTAVAKVAKGETSATATVNVPQLGTSAGTAYITVTKKGQLESDRIGITYAAEMQTPITSLPVYAVNNAVGTADVVTAYGLMAGDMVNVYLSSNGGKSVGTAVAKVAKGETTATVTVSVPQLGSSAGTAYITVTRKGLLESVRIPFTYTAEKQTDIISLSADIVNNAFGTSDIVTVRGLEAGDTVNVYLKSTDVKAAGNAVAKAAKGETSATATVNIPQLGSAAGTAYITVTRKGLLESAKMPVPYNAEKQTTVDLGTLSLNIVNNALGTQDTVTVSNLREGDLVKVYLTAAADTAAGTATAKAAKGESTATATVSIPQLGTSEGIAYLTVTQKGQLESVKIPIYYSAEKKTIVNTLYADIINNAAGTPDTVTVIGLEAGDIVNVYQSFTDQKPLGTATAKAAKGDNTATAVVSIIQLGTSAGTTYVTVTKKGLLESDRKAVTYIGERKTSIPALTFDVVNNAVGTQDTVSVSGLSAGDIVNVYANNIDTKVIGTATAKTVKGESSATAVVSIPQLGSSSGIAYITVTQKGFLESDRIPVSYMAERKTVLSYQNINIVNNAVGTPDTVTVTGLAADDLVNVYLTATAEKPAGSAAAKAVKGESTAAAVVSVQQLGASDGKAYITITKKGLLESDRIAVDYIAERRTIISSLTANIINNAAGTSDTVTVTGLNDGDIVSVYLYNSDSKPAGTATAKSAKGETTAVATVNIPQLGASAGTAYITVTQKGLLESAKMPVTYSEEKKTIVSGLTASIVNNALGTPDTVTINGLSAGDIANVYLSSTAEKAIGSAVAKAVKGETSAVAVVSVPQLSEYSGTAYIGITKKGLLESDRIAVDYTAEKQTSADTIGISVTNNAAGTPDTVTVTGLIVGDTVKVYSTSTAEKPIGTAISKAVKGESSAVAVVSIPQLGASAGAAFVTVTTKGLQESTRRLFAFGAEGQTQISPLIADAINNAAGTPDVITVKNLVAGDIVKVYSSLSATNTIGTATAKAVKGTGSTEAVMNIPQLGPASGVAYITVTRKGLLESIRMPVGYNAEQKTTVTMLWASIVNNAAGTPDIVTVFALTPGDVVNVYLKDTDVKPIATAIAKAEKGESTATATINVPQVGASAGVVYITVANKGLLESDKIPVTFIGERTTEAPVLINQ